MQSVDPETVLDKPTKILKSDSTLTSTSPNKMQPPGEAAGQTDLTPCCAKHGIMGAFKHRASPKKEAADDQKDKRDSKEKDSKVPEEAAGMKKLDTKVQRKRKDAEEKTKDQDVKKKDAESHKEVRLEPTLTLLIVETGCKV